MSSGEFGTDVLHSLSAHIAVLDSVGTIAFVNQAWERFAADNGDSALRATGVGVNYFDVCRRAIGQARAEALHVLERLLAVQSGTRPDFVHEYTCHSPSERRWYVLRATPLQGGGGLVVAHQNTTGRRLVEERLLEETRTAEALNRIARTVGAELDLRKLVQGITDEATALTGARFGAFFYTAVGESGESLMLYTLSGAPLEAFSRFPIPRFTPLFGPTFRGEGPVRCNDVTRDPRYGRNPPYNGMPGGHLSVRSYLAVPVVSRSGGVLGGLFFGHPEAGVFTERSERFAVGIAAQAAVAVDNARLYEQARRDSRLKDQFLMTVSHELRTPLTAVSGWVAMLRRHGGRLDAADTEKGLAAIEHGVGSLARLVGDLLDASRIAAGKFGLNLSPTDLAAPVRNAVEAVRPSADSKSVRLEADTGAGPGLLLADPGRMEQVVWNLLTNAVKFTPAGGVVRVVLDRDGNDARMTVTDTGRGINPGALPRLFERFWQSADAEGAEHGGMGLGLSLVRHLVNEHGGTVQAESPGEGRGATFTVRIPIRRPEPNGS